MKYHPEEVLFSPTTDCNLRCGHCAVSRSKRTLPVQPAVKFLRRCKNIGIKKVGFTGGEPFLAADFLCALVKASIKGKMLFDRITTNGVWYKDRPALERALDRLYKCGYDGSFSVSVDAFHRQDLKKVAAFIRSVTAIWARADAVSIIYAGCSREGETRAKLKKLSRLLKASLSGLSGPYPYIKNKDIFIKIHRIEITPVGRASKLIDPWDGRWFKEDHCKGPGNIFYILPDGSVKPCCGYATDSKELTIGNILCDTPQRILANARKNRFVSTIFGAGGLSYIRKRAQSMGVKFPSKTSNNCYFCHYITTELSKPLLSSLLVK